MINPERPVQSGRVCYLLKRFPRLSETFILNEILSLERLGLPLIVISLLPREEVMAHAAVRNVQAHVHYLPMDRVGLLVAAAKSHLPVFLSSPSRYFRALGTTIWWGLRSRTLRAAIKKFCRSMIVAEICGREHVRHIHAHFVNTPAGVAEIVQILRGLPYSFTAHAKDLYLLRQSLITRRASSAKFIVTCTRYNVDYINGLLSGTERNKVHLVYHGIDLTAFARYFEACTSVEKRDSQDVPVVLSVGRLVPKKGMHVLVDACGVLRDRGIAFRCLIVGKGPLREELQQHITKLGLENKIELVGAMTHEELVEFYGKATLFALVPHLTEDGDRDGIPNVLIEAMAARLPILTTSISGIPEVIEHEKTGLLVGPSDVRATADALQVLLENARLREALANAAYAQLGSRFHCWESTKTIRDLLIDRVVA